MTATPGLDELRGRFWTEAKSYLSTEDAKALHHAEELMLTALEGLTRLSGDPFAVHAYQTALTLAELRLDRPALEAGLLLAAVERQKADIDGLRRDARLHPRTATIVESTVAVNRHRFIPDPDEKRPEINQGKAERFRKIILTLARDIRVIMLKLADRLNSMRTLQHLPKEDRRDIAQQTLDIYAPLAGRLGIHRIKSEMEDLAFRHLEPERYYALKQLVAQKKSQRDEYLTAVKAELRGILDEHAIPGEVSGRGKHFWSIQKKLNRKSVEFDDLIDITAFRIIVDTIAQCYQMLGLVHTRWRPIPGTFDDYIAMPKPNGYQSLHTAVVGPQGERIEVQIRTRQMHDIAENGVAAHWRYKERETGFSEDTVKRFGWLHAAVADSAAAADEQILDSLRTDLFDDEVFVFTPKGDVHELPRGATLVDFAFAVHTGVGNCCVGGKVNNRIATLDSRLNNGDIVQILTNPRAHPSQDWLEFVITEKARQKIRYAVNEQRRENERALGREKLERIIRERGGKTSLFKDESRLARALDKLRIRSLDEVFLSIGQGKVTDRAVVEALAPELLEEKNVPSLEEAFEQAFSKPLPPASRANARSAVVVAGLDNMMVRYGRCCNPVVGDPIVGFITRGRGVTIHRRGCERLSSEEAERIIDASWGVDVKQTTPVRLRIVTQDRKGLLAAVGKVFDRLGVNVSSASVSSHQGEGEMLATIDIHSVDELLRVTATLKATKGVLDVHRVADALNRIG